jgi:hypothetical protein
MRLPEPAAGRPATRLAGDLARLRGLAGGRAVPLSAVVEALDERGFALAVLLLSFPFVLPIPMLGLATPVGCALAAAALGFARGRRAALPGVLGRLPLDPRTLDAMARRVDRAAGLLRPRLGFMLCGRMRAAAGVSLFVGALALAAPVPLPASNFFPAAAMILLAAGLVEGDGLVVLLGHAATAVVCGVAWAASGVAVALAQRLVALLG